MLSKTATVTQVPKTFEGESLDYYKRESLQDKKNPFFEHKMLGSSLEKTRSARATSSSSKPQILGNSNSSKVISDRSKNFQNSH